MLTLDILNLDPVDADSFSKNAVHAASIGQVHKATLGDKVFAVKIQYPGVAESISSDLKLVKPLAAQLLNMKKSEMNLYMDEVESKLLEETDYELELKRSNEISQGSSQLKNIRFPKYYPEFSNKRILTMDWMEGDMFPEFLKTNPSQEVRNSVGQAMWDFYLFQMKVLRQVHADPHPGNFLVDNEGNLIVLDFGCLKFIPEDFYAPYFDLTQQENLNNTDKFIQTLQLLEVIMPNDSQKDIDFLVSIFRELLTVFTVTKSELVTTIVSLSSSGVKSLSI